MASRALLKAMASKAPREPVSKVGTGLSSPKKRGNRGVQVCVGDVPAQLVDVCVCSYVRRGGRA